MTCDSVRPELKAFLDDELSPLAAWRVRRHLRRCASCGAELETLRRFHDRLRAADIVTGDDDTRLPLVPRRVSPAWRLAGGALATAALAALLFVLPTWKEAPRGMAAAVAAALSQANTWHFSGWKEIGGRRVPWDVWGRRKPFLFYEKVGGDITFDDGTQRLRVFPADPALDRPQGLVIRTATEKDGLDGFGPSVKDMASLWDWRQGAGGFAPTPYRRTVSTVEFRLQYPAGVGYGVNANQLYTINRFTWLPTRYQLQFSTDKFHRDVENLQASYNVDLSDAVVTPPAPTGDGRVDFTGSDSLGLNVQATPVDVDRAGNVLVRVRGRLGDVPVTPGSTFTLSASAADSHPFGLHGGEVVRYLPMDAYGYQFTAPNGDVLLWLAPLEPGSGASNLPAALRLTVSVSVNVQNQATDFVGLQDQLHSRRQTETLLTKDFSWTLPLPGKPTVGDIQASPQWHFQWGDNNMWPLEYYMDQARASEYYLGSYGFQADVFRQVAPDLIRRGVLYPDGTPTPSHFIGGDWLIPIYQKHAKEFAAGKQQKRARAVYWLQQEIATLPNTTRGRGWGLIMEQALAKYQQVAGQTAQSRQTLRQLIEALKKLPGTNGQRRQAEYALRTGIFPGDANYKGPS